MMNTIGLNKIAHQRQTPLQVLAGAEFFRFC